jgi:PAS domain S-box-containing protein
MDRGRVTIGAPASMTLRDSPAWSDYAVAVATVAAAILLRALLTPLMGTAFPLATIFSAVAFTSWYSGWRPAMVTTVGGFLAADLVFIAGRTPLFGRPLVPEIFGVGVYLLTCASIVVLGEAGRRALRRQESVQRDLAAVNLALEQKVEAHALLAAIVASSGDAIVSTTLDGTITSWNPGAELLLGYPAADAVGCDVRMIVPADRLDELRHILERTSDGGRFDHLDSVRVTRDGERRDVGLTVSPIHDRRGQVTGTSMVARDITPRKAAEREQQRHEAEQRLLVAIHDATRGLPHASDVMLETVTHVGRHFSATRCAYGEVDLEAGTILITRGYTRDVPTVAGLYPLATFGDEVVAALKGGHTVAVDDARGHPWTSGPGVAATYARMAIASMLCVPMRRSGRLVAILVVGDGTPRTWSAHDHGLLERVAERTLFAVESARATAALRESRDVLALAMRAGRMGAWSRDVATGVVWWSPELESIVGLPPGGFGGSESAFYDIVHPDDRPVLAQAVESALRSRADYRVEFRFRHASGEWRWMEGRGQAAYGADGAPRMLYGLGIDVTERRGAVEALEQADRRKDEFLATLAHELRNPLAPITAGLHVLRATAGEGEAADRARAIIERQVGQMVRLVDDLLDVARISTGKTDLRCEPMELAAAVRDAVETSRPLIEAAGHRLELELPGEPVVVNADRTRLAQVFANLLNNSAKYSPRARSIAVSIERAGHDAAVRVRDDGIGIAPEQLSGIFEMFRQGAPGSGRPQGGLGIGLFLVKRIVEMHGGRVEARSAGLGHGSEFVVQLPALPELVAREVATADGVTPVAVPRRRILVVDDNVDAAAMLASLLSLGGHETRTAHDGVAAIRAADDYRPDVIFLDIGMPLLDGHATAKWIRAQPWGKSTVLVALTGWGQDHDRRRSEEAGFDFHLVKPASPAAIADLIASL